VVAVGTRSWGTGVATPSVGQAYPDADALDAELVAQALHDRAGFAPLYHRYLGPVYGYCRRRLDPQDAEDATSHIFMQALGNIESCRGPSFRAWLFTIAHNVVVDRLRAQKPTFVLDDSLSVPSRDRSPEELALEADRKHRLEAAIRELPPDQRSAIELRLAGLTGIECAQVLGKSAEATRMLQHRAFGTLRASLADLSPGEWS
jgi:RNA polymerase sigma-70 factor (ECF subfamily)